MVVWTESEDALLWQHVEAKGPKQWGVIAAHLKGKSSKQVCVLVEVITVSPRGLAPLADFISQLHFHPT